MSLPVINWANSDKDLMFTGFLSLRTNILYNENQILGLEKPNIPESGRMDLRAFVPVRLNFAVNIKIFLLFSRKGVIILFKPFYLMIHPARVKIYRLCSVCIMGPV
jgi:hypothetical protein